MTIKDIARESGYAVSTVSRALNDHPDVSAETKARIQAVIDAHGFIPNNNAKHLKQTATKSIAIVVKGTSNMLFAPIVERMQDLIKSAGYTDVVYYLDEDSDEVRHALLLCREQKPLGLLFLGGNLSYFRENFSRIRVPSVLVTNPGGALGFPNLSSVSTDDAAAAGRAVDYLIDRGHTRIGVIGGDVGRSYTSQLRLEGCLRSFAARGVSFEPEKQYEKARFAYASAYRAMGRLFDRAPGLTAAFAMSDVMAVGAVRALRDRGLEVPRDLSVVGFDGVELAEYYNPKLATVKQSQERLAVRGVEILINSIENGGDAVHETAPFELIEGESVRTL